MMMSFSEKMKLRPYQQYALDSVQAGAGEHKRQMVVMGTGAGKTIFFSHLADQTPGRTLILAHRAELLDQAIQKLHAATGIIAGREQGPNRACRSHEVVVASVQSMVRRFKEWDPDHFELIICDECHHSVSDSWQKVLEYFSNAKVLGVTATPDREDQRELGAFYTRLAYEIGMMELVKLGYLAPIMIQTCPVKIDIRGVQQRTGDFATDQLGESIDPHLREVVKQIKIHAPNRRTVVFLPLIATSKRFVEIATEEGLDVRHVDGTSEDRKQILKDFSQAKFKVLANAMLLTEGWDDPGVDCIVNLRPTKSRSLYTQIIGRGTRIAPGKDNLLVLDFLWQFERHSLIRPAHLVAPSEEVAEAMTQISEAAAMDDSFDSQDVFDLEDLETHAQQTIEDNLKAEMKRMENRKAQLINACEYIDKIGKKVDYKPNGERWKEKPVTEKQRELIEKQGVDIETVENRGHASAIIDAFIQHQNAQPASMKQWYVMRKNGYSSDERPTVEQARDFFQTLHAR